MARASCIPIITKCAIFHPIHSELFDNRIIIHTREPMSNDLTLAGLPIEVLLDNLLPYVQVPDLCRLTCTSKVRFLWISNIIISPYMSSGSCLRFSVRTIPCGNANYSQTLISPVRGLLGQAAGSLYIEAFLNREVSFIIC